MRPVYGKGGRNRRFRPQAGNIDFSTPTFEVRSSDREIARKKFDARLPDDYAGLSAKTTFDPSTNQYVRRPVLSSMAEYMYGGRYYKHGGGGGHQSSGGGEEDPDISDGRRYADGGQVLPPMGGGGALGALGGIFGLANQGVDLYKNLMSIGVDPLNLKSKMDAQAPATPAAPTMANGGKYYANGGSVDPITRRILSTLMARRR